MSAIEILSMSYRSGAPDATRFPDLESCVMGLPLAYATGADEFWVHGEGEAHHRTYSVAQVELALSRNPHMAALQGLGNVDPEHGWNFMPGRNILFK
jgi:hypothetical protein